MDADPLAGRPRRQRALRRVLRAVPRNGTVQLLSGGETARALLAGDWRARLVAAGASAETSVDLALDEAGTGRLCAAAGRLAVAGVKGAPHRAVEAWFAEHGFRPYAREAELPWLRPWWVYVFLRDADRGAPTS